MKCPKCNAITKVTQCVKGINNSLMRTRRCTECDCEFRTYEINEESLRDYLAECRKKQKDKEYTANSLCWECARATGFCPWSRYFEPVQGWEARRTIIRQSQDVEVESYDVFKCPLFEPDRRK